MERPNTDNVSRNKTREYYYKLCKILYALGAPNFWHGDLGIPKYAATIHDVVVWIVDLAIYVYLVSILGANFTQHNLSEKQKSDLQLFCISQPPWYFNSVVLNYYKKDVRLLSYNLAIKLKNIYNDPEVENEMVQSVKIYVGIFLCFAFSALILFGLHGLMEVIYHGKNFVVISPVWPDVNDTSTAASIIGVYHYVVYWIFTIRTTTSGFIEVIMLTICLSHQYKNLSSYFRSLNTIFEDKELTQKEKEEKYEQAFKIGIHYHNITLRCKKRIEKIFYIVFSVQIFINLSTITVMLSQLVNSERSLTNLLTISVSIGCVLISTGCFWCSAGDVTVERITDFAQKHRENILEKLPSLTRVCTATVASQLSMAMFESGWQHCRGRAALRTRTLLGVAMWHSQRPVQIRCLGFVRLSYSSYVKIVKLSYQIFTVLYSR